MSNFIQSKSAGASSTTPAVTLTAAPSVGSLLVAFISSGVSQASISITGWNGLTLASGAGGACRFFWKIAGAAESATVTGSVASTGQWWISVAEFRSTGASPAAADNARVNASGTTTSPDVTPPAGVTVLAVGAVSLNISGTYSGQAITGGTGTGVGTVGVSANTLSGTVFYADILSPNGTYHADATGGGAASGAAAIAFFTLSKSLPYERRARRSANTRV